jgi:hypothetical protein
VLHHARGTSVHRELRALAEEVARDLGLVPERPARAVPGTPKVASLKTALLRGFGSR